MSSAPDRASGDVGGTATLHGADTHTRDRLHWLDQVLADRELTSFAFAVAYVVASFVNRETGEAWPSQATIAEKVGGKERGVRNSIEQLADRGHLAISTPNGRKGVNHYRMILKDTAEVIELHRHCHDGEKPVHRHGGAGKGSVHRHGDAGMDAVHRHGGAGLTGMAMPPIPLKETSELEESISASSKPKRRPPIPKAKTSDEDFAAWWLQVPKAVGKADARRAYDKIITSGAATHAELLAGMMRYSAERQGQDSQYTKHPATWLNKGCWSDAPAQPRPAVRNEPMTRTQASRSEASLALDAIAKGWDPEHVKRGLHLNSQSRRMKNANDFWDEMTRRGGENHNLRENPSSMRVRIANEFGDRIRRRSGRYPDDGSEPIIIGHEDQGDLL